MRTICRTWLVVAGLWLAAPQLPAVVPRTVSTSRQFIVFGEDARLRGSVAQAAEQVKAELLALLQAPDRWSVPILLNVGQPQANVPDVPAVALNFSQTGAGLKIQIDLLIDRSFDPATLRREVLRGLLLEMSYRALPSLPAGEVYNPPPEWLVDAVLDFNNQSPELMDALQSTAASPPSLKNLLALHPALLDSQSRTLYRACARALLRLLLAPPDGRAQVARYITELPRASPDAIANLQAHFPSLGNNDAQMEKNWREGFERIAREGRFTLFPFEVTSQRLDECLHENVARDREGKNFLNLEQTVATRRPKIDRQAAGALRQKLMLLGTHAHPLLRPVVIEYERAAEILAHGRTGGLAKFLAATAALRQRLAARAREMDDYMNWFEATQSRTSSGTFRDYLRAAETQDETVRRHDPISVYLDAMENEMQ